jgi:Calcineurin-like phosphoesterase
MIGLRFIRPPFSLLCFVVGFLHADDLTKPVSTVAEANPAPTKTIKVESSGTSAHPKTTGRDSQKVRFAVIGDFGLDNYKPKTTAKTQEQEKKEAPKKPEDDDDHDDDEALLSATPFETSQVQRNPHEAAVAKLVKSWQPDFIVTTGDNNYPKGEASTIDDNIGKYYSDYIGNYRGAFGKGSTTNRFFPVLGNHDWYATKVGCQAHIDYFTLPGNERYYDFQQGPLHFFMLDNDAHEPEGVSLKSKQHAWFSRVIAESKAPFQIVVAHHPPYSSGEHGGISSAQWRIWISMA